MLPRLSADFRVGWMGVGGLEATEALPQRNLWESCWLALWLYKHWEAHPGARLLFGGSQSLEPRIKRLIPGKELDSAGHPAAGPSCPTAGHLGRALVAESWGPETGVEPSESF